MRRLAVCLVATIGLAGGGCGADLEAGEGAKLTVYVSAPLTGPAQDSGRDIADAAALALADQGGEVDGYSIEVEMLDGSAGPRGWTPARAAANARTASQDSTAIAYLGEFESGATRVSLPVTNDARLLQVSPASAATDLAAPTTASDEVPEEVQTSGERTFGRVIPSDAAQARAAAAWAVELGWKRIAVRADGSRFGDVLAGEFERQAGRQGIEIVPGREDGVYFAGSPQGLRALGDDLVVGGPPGQIASDAFLEPYAEPSATRLAGPIYVTSAALDPRQLAPAGRRFARRFANEYGRPPGRYAAYGYEAMAVILDALERAAEAADRQAVIDAFLATADRDSILGSYSITETGETSLDRISGYELRQGHAKPVSELRVP